MKIRFPILTSFIILTCNIFSQSGLSNRIDAYGNFLSGNYIEAVKSFSEIESEGNLIPKDRLSLGIAQFNTGDMSNARRNFQIAAESGIADANLGLAKIYAIRRNTDDAILFIERYLRTAKDPDVNAVQKDSSFRYLHDNDKWFDLWQTDWLSANQKIIQEARFYKGRKKYNVSHKILESNITEDKDKADLYMENASTYLAEENPTLALNELNQALQIDPSNTNYLKERSRCFVLINKYNSAVEDLQRALDIDPVDFETRLQMAKAALKAEDLELAAKNINIYTQYIINEESLFLTGQISYASENYFDALKNFNRLIIEAKPNASYFEARGLTYYQSGAYTFASKDFSMSLDLEPGNGITNLYMGLSEYYNGNNKTACYYWKRAKSYGELKAIEYLQKYCKQ